MRLIYFGSGAFGLPTLKQLDHDHELIAVVTQPDRPAGRKRTLTPTPVGQWADQRGLDVLKAADVNQPGFVTEIEQLQPDAAVVIAFGQKISPRLLAVCGDLAINLHGSLVPRYRGAAPINWAMIDHQPITGVSVIGLGSKMDAGPIYARRQTPIDPDETAGELHDRLADLGPEVLPRVLDDFAANRLAPQAQDPAWATQAPKLRKADGTVTFDQPAEQVRSRIHGLTPWPGCRVGWHHQGQAKPRPLILRRVAVTDTSSSNQPPGTVLDDGQVVTSDATVRLGEVQPPGSKPMSIEEFLHGHDLSPGDHLSAWAEHGH